MKFETMRKLPVTPICMMVVALSLLCYAAGLIDAGRMVAVWAGCFGISLLWTAIVTYLPETAIEKTRVAKVLDKIATIGPLKGGTPQPAPFHFGTAGELLEPGTLVVLNKETGRVTKVPVPTVGKAPTIGESTGKVQ